MRAVEAVIRELAQNRVPVLIFAETGTGKRTAARRIHEAGGGPLEEFRVVPCGGLEPQHEGKHEPWLRPGTVFLEEVGDLSAEYQAGLVEILSRVNQDTGEAGGPRLICGSSRDLEAEVRSGRFREDLYYRISGVCLRLPPLRQRKEDLVSLTRFFLAKHAEEFHRPVPALSAQTQELFRDYAWPGNVRELEDVTRAIVVLGDEALAMGGLRAMLMKSDRSSNGERVSLKQAARAASREAEKELILKALTRNRWNRRRAAQQLQISYKALLYKLKQIGCGEFEAP
jgi:DNA-binding NtrC family response regulator